MSDARPAFRRNASWTLLGNVVFAGSLWGVLTCLARFGSPDMVGRYSLASAVASPIVMFSNLQLRAVLATDAEDRFHFRDYAGLRALTLPLALLLVAVTAGLAYGREQFAVIVIFGLARCVEGVSDLLYGFAQKHEHLDLVARSLILKGVAGLGGFVGLLLATGSLAWSLAGLAAGWGLVMLAYDLRWSRGLRARLDAGSPGRPRLRPETLRALAWLALPLGVTMLLLQLRNTVPRTFLEAAHGEAALGIFSAMAYLIIVGNTLTTAVSQAVVARLARARAARDAPGMTRMVVRLVLFGAAIGVAGVLVAVLAGGPLLSFLYGPEYASRQDVFVLVMIAGGVTYVGSLLGSPATAMRAFRVQFVIQGVNVLLLLVAGARLIPARGMEGAAWTMIIGACWTTAAYAAVVARGIRRLGAPS